jgi:hypothetical protein
MAASITMLVIVAQPASATWDPLLVTDTGNSSSPTSRMLVASNGTFYVTWQSEGSDELYWAKRLATGYRERVVNGANTIASCYTTENDYMGPSATILPNGQFAIASACEAFTAGSPTLYTVHTSGGWKTTTVGYGPDDPNCANSATDVDLIVSPTGQPVIFTTDECLKGVYGFFHTATGWQGRWVVDSGGCCSAFRFGSMSLAVDPLTGDIAMAMNTDDYGREGMYFEEFDWKGAPVAGSYHGFTLPNGDVPYGEPSLAFENDGTGYVAYQEGTPPGTASGSATTFLALAERSASGQWSRRRVDHAVQFTGGEPDLSLAGGSFHIAYRDDTTKDLRIATSPDGVTWTTETIAGAGDNGNFPSIAVASDGRVGISFYHRTDTSLRSIFGP